MAQGASLRAVAPAAQSIRLDVRFDGELPTGHVIAADGRTRRFAGWLGLMAAVEALATDGEPTGDQEDVHA